MCRDCLPSPEDYAEYQAIEVELGMPERQPRGHPQNQERKRIGGEALAELHRRRKLVQHDGLE